MESRLSSVIEKVQKLLALSKSANPNEAAAAAAAANRLIDQHRLSEADLVEAEVDPMVEDEGYIYESGKITQWKVMLLLVLSRHYGVAHFNDIHYPEGRKVSRFKLLGRKSDIEITKYMFSWLMMECQRLTNAQAKGLGRVFAASYCEGFVNGVAIQLHSSRQEAQKTATSAAIVKLDARLKESKDFMYANYNLRKAKAVSRGQRDMRAFVAGEQQGKNIHLGQSLGTGKMRLLGI